MTTQKIFFSLIIILFTIATGLNITGCQSIPQTNEAIFDFFEYQGEDVFSKHRLIRSMNTGIRLSVVFTRIPVSAGKEKTIT